MADDAKYLAGVVSGEMKVVREIVSDMRAENKANHRENTDKIDKLLTDVHTVKSRVEEHHKWIETDGKPTSQKIKNAKYWLLGAAGGSTALATSPTWFTKVLAIIGH